MTLILATRIPETTEVFLMSDGLYTREDSYSVMRCNSEDVHNTKITRVNDLVMLGVAGNVKNAQILLSGLDVVFDSKYNHMTMTWEDVVSDIVPKIFKLLEDKGGFISDTVDDRSLNMDIVIVSGHTIFTVYEYGEVLENVDFAVIGSPSEYVLGCNDVLKSIHTEDVITRGLLIMRNTISRFSNVCGYPIKIIAGTDEDPEDEYIISDIETLDMVVLKQSETTERLLHELEISKQDTMLPENTTRESEHLSAMLQTC